jgi:hypothetical protein
VRRIGERGYWHIRIGRFPLCTMGLGRPQCGHTTLTGAQLALDACHKQGSTTARVVEGRCPQDPPKGKA